MKIYTFLALSFLLFVTACKSTNSTNKTSSQQLSQADNILADAVKAHGGNRYDKAHYEFIFRKNKYTFKNNNGGYEYTMQKVKNGKMAMDKMTNNDFTRMVDGQKMELSQKEESAYSNSLNSVIYFATLPHKLQDPAINKTYKGTTTIKGKTYEVLEITFDEEGGGKDHEDVYYYWINQETNVIDFFAYNYLVNNGGVRFRSAYNTRKVDGILFQDYINFKAPVGTPLSELPKLYEKEKLKKMSLIETEAVRKL